MHKTLTDNPPIHIYINRINNRLMFKIKDVYKLELQTPRNYLAAQKNDRQTKERRKCT